VLHHQHSHGSTLLSAANWSIYTLQRQHGNNKRTEKKQENKTQNEKGKGKGKQQQLYYCCSYTFFLFATRTHTEGHTELAAHSRGARRPIDPSPARPGSRLAGGADRFAGSLELRVAEHGRLFGREGHVGAAERARGALVPEPGLEAGAVEEVAAGEAVHHGLRHEPGQAHAAVVAVRVRRAARRRRRHQHPVQRRPERPQEPVRQAQAQAGPRRHEAAPGGVVPADWQRGGLEVQEHQRLAHQPRQRRDRDHRVVHQVPQQAVPRLRHARDPHRRPTSSRRRLDLGGGIRPVDRAVISDSFGVAGARSGNGMERGRGGEGWRAFIAAAGSILFGGAASR